MIDEFARALARNLKFRGGKSWTRASVADNQDTRLFGTHVSRPLAVLRLQVLSHANTRCKRILVIMRLVYT